MDLGGTRSRNLFLNFEYASGVVPPMSYIIYTSYTCVFAFHKIIDSKEI